MLDLVWFLVALVLGAIGWGMFRLTRRAARTRILSGVPWAASALALVPAAIYGFMIARFLVEVAIDPTSNNLWPLMVAFLLVLWAGYALALRLVLGLAGLVLRSGS